MGALNIPIYIYIYIYLYTYILIYLYIPIYAATRVGAATSKTYNAKAPDHLQALWRLRGWAHQREQWGGRALRRSALHP